MLFATNNAERMRITSGGDVAIGNTSAILSSSGRGNLTINGSSQSIMVLGNGGSNAGYLYATSSILELSSAAQPIAFSANGAERMRINTSGELLINTTSDAGDYKLQVNGNTYASGSQTVGVNGADGNIYIGGWNSAQARIINNSGYNSTYNGVQIEANYNGANSLPSWALDLGGVNNPLSNADKFAIGRKPNGGSYTTLFYLDNSGNGTFTGSIKTAAPSGGTAKPWKLGNYVSTAVTLDAAYVEVEIDGVAYKLATVYLPEPDPEPTSGPSLGYKTTEKPIVKLKSDSQKVKDLEKEIAELKELIKSKIK